MEEIGQKVKDAGESALGEGPAVQLLFLLYHVKDLQELNEKLHDEEYYVEVVSTVEIFFSIAHARCEYLGHDFYIGI